MKSMQKILVKKMRIYLNILICLTLSSAPALSDSYGLYKCTAISGAEAQGDGSIALLSDNNKIFEYWKVFILDIETGFIRNFLGDVSSSQNMYVWQKGGQGNDYVLTYHRPDMYGLKFPNPTIRVRTWADGPITFQVHELSHWYTGTCAPLK